MRALVLVDLQYDFMPGGALAVSEGDATVPVANALMRRFDMIVATQDWHPADHGSFVTQHPGAETFAQVDLHGLPQTVWPVHCVQNTRGAALHDELDRSGIHRVFPKGTDPRVDSYSGFFDNARRNATGLFEYLTQHGVREVFAMGLATDYCVKFTALDAVDLGFRTHVIADGCRAVNLTPGDERRALDELRAAGVQITTATELAPARA
jgi:nicotinamidase/pyrazinamidase